MPEWEVTLSDGRVVTVTTAGTEAPTPEQALAAVNAMNPEQLKGVTHEPKTLSGFMSNVVGSGKRTLGDLAQMINHPIDTATGIGKVAIGAAQKLIPGEQSLEPNADAVGEFYKQRYGGLSNIGETMYNDPVGTVLDVASVASGVGGALKGGASVASKLGQAGRAAELMSNAGRTLETVGSLGVTPERVRGVAEAAVNRSVRNVPKALRDQTPNMAGRMIDEGITVTRKGAEKAEDASVAAQDAFNAANARMVASAVNRPPGARVRQGGRFTGQRAPNYDPAAVEEAVTAGRGAQEMANIEAGLGSVVPPPAQPMASMTPVEMLAQFLSRNGPLGRIGATSAAAGASGHQLGLGTLAAGATGAAMTAKELFDSPAAMSRAGVALGQPAVTKSAPEIIRYLAMLQAMQGQQSP